MITSDPKYDTDAVNLRYLNKIISKENENTKKELISYGKNFNSPPNPPYYKGWTYTSNDKIYRCIKDRKIGVFSELDWIVIYDGKQNKLISDNFIYLSEIELENQSDNKVETFYQEQDPSISWDTLVTKSMHEGDYWRTKKESVYYSYIYTKLATNPIAYDWLEIQVPLSIFNTITGHRNIFLTIPEKYEKDDFLKIINNDMKKCFSFDVNIGTFLYAKKSNNSFDQDDWIIKDDEMSLKSILTYYSTIEEVNKILEEVNRELHSDIVKTEKSITAYVKEEYTEKTITENIKKTVDANGQLINQIKGNDSSEVAFKNLTQLTLELDQIKQQISKTIVLTNNICMPNRCEIINAAEGDLLELKIKGYFSLLFPSKNIFPSDQLKLRNSYLVIEYEDNTKKLISLPVTKMRVLGEVSDEFVITSEKTYLIKRIGVSEDNNEYVLPKEEIIEYELINIPLKRGRNIVYVSSFQSTNLQYEATYCIKNEFTDLFATKIEMMTRILATAEGILLETSNQIETATGSDKLIAKINMFPGAIDITGTVTANEKFKILPDGSMKAVDAELEGNITANNLYLRTGGKVLGGDGMMTNLQFQCNSGETDLGWYTEDGTSYIKHGLQIKYDIPNNFTIIDAYIILTHVPCINEIFSEAGTTTYSAYARSIKLYKVNSLSSVIYRRYGLVGEPDYSSLSKSNISEAFGSSGYTGNPSIATTIKSGSFPSYLSSGESGMLLVDTAENSVSSWAEALQKTTRASATLIVLGYMNYEGV